MKQIRRRLQYGFTVLELFALVAAIGVLLAIVLSARAGVVMKERNNERQRDIAEIRDVLEAYYAQNDRYPTLAVLNGEEWRTANARSVDTEVWHDPGNDSVDPYRLADKPAANVFAYQPKAASGDACDNKKVACTQYTLTATPDGGGAPYIKNNLN